MQRQIQKSQAQKLQSFKQLSYPKRIELLLHGVKTAKLLKALVTDRRIPIWRKGVFVASTAGLLVLLLLPDIPAVLGFVLPIIGTVLGVPLDAGVDWVAFALLSPSLMRIFPSQIVAEHYTHLFKKDKSREAHTS